MVPPIKEPAGRRPRVAVLVDRSRDLLAPALIDLEPDDVYHTTDSRVGLRASSLAAHDVLVIAGHAPDGYSRRETDAIVKFVRRGGGLLLAASAGLFERHTARPADEMAVAAVGRRFGIEFLSPRQAVGRTAAKLNLARGYRPETVRVGPPLNARGVWKADVFLDGWSPVRSMRRGTVLLRHATTREPAAVAVRFGRGRVVAVGAVSFLKSSHRLCRHLMDLLPAGSPRAGQARRLPHEVFPKYLTRRSGSVRLRYGPALAGRAGKVLRFARKLTGRFETWVSEKRPRPWRIELTGSCGHDMDWRGPYPHAYVGVAVPDAALAFSLGAALTETLAWRSRIGWPLWESVLGREALSHFLGLTAMHWLGFEAEAERLGADLGRESRRQFGRIDAGWFYSHGVESPGLWIWQELARRHGDDLVERFFRSVPAKLDRSAAPEAVYRDLDVAIHFLSRAARTDLYPWFAGIGATVHPLPPARWGGKAFKRGVRRNLRRQLADRTAPASEQADAVEALLACDEADKRPLAAAARLLRSRAPAARLAAAGRLAKARDSRAAAVLRQLSRRRDDPGLAAVAALLAVECGDRGAAGRLAELAEGADPRFQLDAGCQLARVGHPRAERFSLGGIARADGPSAARIETVNHGEVMVFPTVAGRHAANIFSGDVLGHLPHNTHVSMLFVYWVHTGRKWRRKGLSRLAMQRSLADARARRCSCAALGTGTRNVAHALYRSFGFVDAPPGEVLKCKLAGAPPARRVRGVKVRPVRPGDEPVLARLFNARYADSAVCRPARPRRLPPGAIGLIAHRAGRPAGYLHAEPGVENATLRVLAVPKGKHADDVAAALVGRLHRILSARGLKRVDAWHASDTLAPLLQGLGYRGEKHGGVDMFAVLDLPQLLEEMKPLLARRLAETGFCGTIDVLGERHRAALRIDRGRVEVLRRPTGRANIELAGSDATVTRIVAGIVTPFEAYLQLDLKIMPVLNDGVRDLLERLFPRLEVFRWFW